MMNKTRSPRLALMAVWPTALLIACGGSDDPAAPPAAAAATLPQLSVATAATLLSCADLATSLALPSTSITSAVAVAEGALVAAGVTTPVPAHCLVKGKMNQRTSPVDGASYAISFEMRLPVAWNGRFLHQGNGGIDGSVVTALGSVSGGAPVAPGLSQGFAVLSSDGGHNLPTPFFGLDPQARLDYGYQAVGSLTPGQEPAENRLRQSA